MTTAQQVSRMIRQGFKAIAETFKRLYELADFIIRINEIENSKRVGSPESIESFREELDRFGGKSTSARQREQDFANRLECRERRPSHNQGGYQMGQTVEQFGARCRDILKQSPRVGGS